VAAILLLDAEGVSALAMPGERGVARRRAQALLSELARREGVLRIPSIVLAEVYRGPAREAAINRLINGSAGVITTGQALAKGAARLLERDGLNSCHVVDACLVATAIALGGAVIATADPDDIRSLARDHQNVVVAPL
jgi:predicted nucleic acid-binding protein